MATDEMIAVPASLIQRCAAFAKRALSEKCGADQLEVYALDRGDALVIASYRLSADDDAAELGQDMAQAITDYDADAGARVDALKGGERVATLALPAMKRKGKGELLKGESRDHLLTNAIQSQQRMLSMVIASWEGIQRSQNELITAQREELAELRADARESAKAQSEMLAARSSARVHEAQAKAIEDLTKQVIEHTPRLLSAVSRWAGGGVPSDVAELVKLGPDLLGMLRALDADVITMMASQLDPKGKAALVRAWEIANKGGATPKEGATQ